MASNLPSTAARTISGPASPRATRHSTCRPRARARSAPRSTTSLASSVGSMPVVGRLVLGDVEQGDRDRRVEEADDGVEEVGAQGAAVVGQEQPLDPVPALAQLGEELGGLGGRGAGLGDLAAAGDVQPHVAVLAQHADRQRLGLGAADVQPVERHLVELVLGADTCSTAP